MEEKKKEIKKAIIFFDGNNFYHNLKVTFINPGSVHMGKVSQLVGDHFKCDVVKSIYYNSVPSIEDGKDKYYKHMKFLSEVGSYQNFEVKTRKLQRLSNKEAINVMNHEVSNLGLCKICKPIVLSHWADYIGSVSVKEKGIDVLICVDMIKLCLLEKKCDACIVVSGDADFIPALELLRNSGIWVATAMTAKGYSFDIRRNFPWFILDKDLLKDKCLKTA